MRSLVGFLLASFAVYRLSLAIAEEEGPWNAFSRLRAYAEDSEVDWIEGGVNCPLCLSFWLGFVFAIFLPRESAREYFYQGAGLSGAATMLIFLSDALAVEDSSDELEEDSDTRFP